MTHLNDVPKGPAREFTVRFRKPDYLTPAKFMWIAYLEEPDFKDQAYADTPEEAMAILIRKHGWMNLGESVL